MTWIEWAQVVATSTVLAALINQLISALAAGRRQRRELDRQTAGQQAAEEHQLATQVRDLDHQAELQRREHEHQQLVQEEQRRHEALLREEASHAAARDRFIGDVSDAVYWIEHRAGEVHGLDGDWVPDHSPTPRLKTVPEVCEVLRAVETQHPSAVIRQRAAGLRRALEGQYGSIEQVYDQPGREWVRDTGNDPSRDRFQEWIATGKALIEEMHASSHEI